MQECKCMCNLLDHCTCAFLWVAVRLMHEDDFFGGDEFKESKGTIGNGTQRNGSMKRGTAQ